MPSLDYTIVVPSRKRTHNMPALRSTTMALMAAHGLPSAASPTSFGNECEGVCGV